MDSYNEYHRFVVMLEDPVEAQNEIVDYYMKIFDLNRKLMILEGRTPIPVTNPEGYDKKIKLHKIAAKVCENQFWTLKTLIDLYEETERVKNQIWRCKRENEESKECCRRWRR